MIRILLIRHGHTELLGKVLYGRMAGVELSQRGREEVARLGLGLQARYEIDEIVSSPMDRAKETAEAVADAYGRSIIFDEDLQELNFGQWTGRSFSDLASDELWRAYNRVRSLTCTPGGELMIQVQARAWSALQRIIERQKDRLDASIAVITHGDVVRALLMLFLGMPLDHIHRLEIATASVSEVILADAFSQVITINQTFSIRDGNCS